MCFTSHCQTGSNKATAQEKNNSNRFLFALNRVWQEGVWDCWDCRIAGRECGIAAPCELQIKGTETLSVLNSVRGTSTGLKQV